MSFLSEEHSTRYPEEDATRTPADGISRVYQVSNSFDLDEMWQRQCETIRKLDKCHFNGEAYDILTLFSDGIIEITFGEVPRTLDFEDWRQYMRSEDHRFPLNFGRNRTTTLKRRDHMPVACYMEESRNEDMLVCRIEALHLCSPCGKSLYDRVRYTSMFSHLMKMIERESRRNVDTLFHYDDVRFFSDDLDAADATAKQFLDTLSGELSAEPANFQQQSSRQIEDFLALNSDEEGAPQPPSPTIVFQDRDETADDATIQSILAWARGATLHAEQHDERQADSQ